MSAEKPTKIYPDLEHFVPEGRPHLYFNKNCGHYDNSYLEDEEDLVTEDESKESPNSKAKCRKCEEEIRLHASNTVKSKEATSLIFSSPAMYTAVAVLVILVAIISYHLPFANHENGCGCDDLKDRIKTVRADFPTQGQIWSEFLSGINRTVSKRPTQPSVFLLVGHGSDSAPTAECLARRVGRAARCYLNADVSAQCCLNATMSAQRCPNTAPLSVDGAAINADLANGSFIEHYRPLVEHHGIFIITNVDAIPPDVARHLHGFTDEVSPLVPRAVYIFTVQVSEPWDAAVSASRVAEERLNAAWTQLTEGTREALVTRVMGGAVMDVRTEATLQNC